MSGVNDWVTPGADDWVTPGGGPPRPSPNQTAGPVSPQSASPAPSWRDWFMQRLAAGARGTGLSSALFSPTQNLGEAATFGSGLTGGLSNLIPGASEAAAAANLDPQSRIALQGAGYLAGPGKLFNAARAATGLSELGGVTGWGARALSSGAEGAGMSALGTATQGGSASDIEKAAGIGGVLGTGAGALAGVGRTGGELPPAKSAGQLSNEASAAWAPISGIGVDTGDLISRIDATTNAIRTTPEWANLLRKPDTKATLNELAGLRTEAVQAGLGGPAMTPQQAAVMKQVAGLSPAAQAQVFKQMGLPMPGAGSASTTLPATVVNTSQDLLGGKGPIGNFAASELNRAFPPGAADAIAQAKTLSGQLKDVQRMTGFQEAAARPGGPDVADQVRSWLQSDEGMRFAAPNTPAGQAYEQVAKAEAPQVSLMPTSFDIRHAAGPMVTLGIGGGLLGLHEGHHDLPTIASDVAEGAALGYGAHRVLPYVYSRAVQQPAQERAIAAFYPSITTGAFQPSISPAAPVRDALRALIFGRGAAGGY